MAQSEEEKKREAEEKQYTIFNNGKMFGGQRKPHSCSSYKDQYGTLVRFRDIPLNDINGKPHLRPAKAGEQPTLVTWGQDLDFSKTNTYRLHNKIHEHVITAIQDHPGTVTSKYPKRKNGLVIQHEPNLEREIRAKKADATLNVFSKAYELLNQEDQSTCDLIFAHLGMAWKNKSDKKEMLVDLIGSPAGQKMFLDSFATGKSLKIKEDLKFPAMVKMAINKGIIVAGSDFIYRMKGTNIQLGSDISKIHQSHNDKMTGIIAALGEAGYLSKEVTSGAKKSTK